MMLLYLGHMKCMSDAWENVKAALIMTVVDALRMKELANLLFAYIHSNPKQCSFFIAPLPPIPPQAVLRKLQVSQVHTFAMYTCRISKCMDAEAEGEEKEPVVGECASKALFE